MKRKILLQQSFGKQLKAIRVSKGLTQQELATLSNCSSEFISRLERGLHSPSFSLLSSIAGALKVHPKELFDFNF